MQRGIALLLRQRRPHPLRRAGPSALGFSQVRTDSYELRSAVLDQLAALVSGSHDVAAYTFANRRYRTPATPPPATPLPEAPP